MQDSSRRSVALPSTFHPTQASWLGICVDECRQAAGGEAQGTGGRQRRAQRRGGGGSGTPDTASPPIPRTPRLSANEDLEFSRDLTPMREVTISPRLSPQMQSSRPPTQAVSILSNDKSGGQQQRTAAPRQPATVETLEAATANMSIREDTQHPQQHATGKQGRQRGRNRGRSNMSKNSSPQRLFNPRSLLADKQPATKPSTAHVDTPKPVDLPDTTRRGVPSLSFPSQQPQESDVPHHPVVRLPDQLKPPASESHGSTTNNIRSEETNFGSDISRGAVHEGRLYNHKAMEKSTSPKRQPVKPVDTRLPEESSLPQKGGLLRLQPGTFDQTRNTTAPSAQQQPRGGLLRIDPHSPKPPQRDGKRKPAHRDGQSSEFNRNAVPLRQGLDDEPHTTWNPDGIPWQSGDRSSSGPTMTPEIVFTFVNDTYTQIEAMERKVKMIYDTHDDMEYSRTRQRRDAVAWTAYSKTHKE